MDVEDGSMGEYTEVASANRGFRGDGYIVFDLTLELVVVAEEESQGLMVIMGVSGFLGEERTGLVIAIVPFLGV